MIDKLYSLEDVPKLLFGLFENCLDIFERVTSNKSQITIRSVNRAQNGALCNHTECSFSSYKQMLHVITSVVLPQVGHVVEDLAAGEDSLKADAVRME